jgi:hypothetical protein
MGWQMFSLSNIGKCSGIGNPLALHRHRESGLGPWQHKTVFSYRGLIEMIEDSGFSMEKVIASGYYPFPARFAELDPRHGHFITVMARKSVQKNNDGLKSEVK